jgi:hypothetical protein
MRAGTEHASRSGRRASGSTFVELIVTMLLLVLFAVLAFPLYWSASKAGAAHGIDNAAQRARLTLASVLPRLTEDVRPPYWENQEKIFSSSGGELSACFYGGKKDDRLILRKAGDSRLSMTTPSMTLSIDDLKGLGLDWWTVDGRIVGLTVSWTRGSETMRFRAAWGAFTL